MPWRGTRRMQSAACLERSRSKRSSTLAGKNPKEGAMSQTAVERAAEHIAESAHQASRSSSVVADAMEDGVGVVRRAAKRGCDASEEFLDDTTQRIQRHP